MTEFLQRFFALLSIVAVAVAVVSVLALSLYRRMRLAAAFVDALAPVALWLAAAVAATATAGSLYFSEVANYTPCVLCWYQRIAMYPLAVLCTIAAARRTERVGAFVYPFVVVGAAIAGYHRYVELNPVSGGMCDVTAPCSAVWFESFGVFTLPVMAASGFVAVGALVAVAGRRRAA